jgi:hypothetical protein
VQISREAFLRRVGTAEVLEVGRHGPKVWRTPDGQIIKLFIRRRRLSSAARLPRGLRFVENTHRLRALELETIRVDELWDVEGNDTQALVYRELPGAPVRDVVEAAAPADRAALLERFLAYMAHLHELGILFRSLQLGNLLFRQETDDFALIDVDDMRFQGRPLGAVDRLRNFRHLIHNARDWRLLTEFGWDRVVPFYREHAAMPLIRDGLFTAGWRLWFRPRYTRRHRVLHRGARKRLRNLFGHLAEEPLAIEANSSPQGRSPGAHGP